MGLDGVEFVMALEETFDIAISDADAAAMRTPRLVLEYLEARLPMSAEDRCSEQRAFHHIRRAGMKHLGLPRRAFRPEARWKDLLPEDGASSSAAWRAVREETGFTALPKMFLGPFKFGFGGRQTIGESCRTVAHRNADLLRRPGEGWSRRDLEKILTGLIAEELGILKFGWDQDFVKDLGID